MDNAPSLFFVNIDPYITPQYKSPSTIHFHNTQKHMDKRMPCFFLLLLLLHPPTLCLCVHHMHHSLMLIACLGILSVPGLYKTSSPAQDCYGPFSFFSLYLPSLHLAFLLVTLLFGFRGGGPHCRGFHYFTVVLCRFFFLLRRLEKK